MRIENISLNDLPLIKKTANPTSNVSFSDMLNTELSKLNDMQLNAEQSTLDLLTGKATDIHQVLLATEEAKLSLELAVQIRNKLIDAYHEISRMQL